MKRLLSLMCVLLLLAGCTPAGQEASQINIVATTYPTYLAALAVTEGVEGVSVSRLDTGSVSCLHDYTLTVNDMKKLSRADVIVMNGAGMEDFMSDALATTHALVIDCSQGIDLLPAAGHHDHDHEHEHDNHFDSHYWMDPSNMSTLVSNIQHRLSTILESQSSTRLTSNAARALTQINSCKLECRTLVELTAPDISLITFHDGFQYFAHAFGFPLLRAIEEEAGSEASAKEIVEISQLVKEYHIPVIFTEVNGSDATAQAIARETGCTVSQLSMIMDGRDPSTQDSSPIAPYIEAIRSNITAIISVFPKQEVD